MKYVFLITICALLCFDIVTALVCPAASKDPDLTKKTMPYHHLKFLPPPSDATTTAHCNMYPIGGALQVEVVFETRIITHHDVA